MWPYKLCMSTRFNSHSLFRLTKKLLLSFDAAILQPPCPYFIPHFYKTSLCPPSLCTHLALILSRTRTELHTANLQLTHTELHSAHPFCVYSLCSYHPALVPSFALPTYIALNLGSRLPKCHKTNNKSQWIGSRLPTKLKFKDSHSQRVRPVIGEMQTPPSPT